MSCSYQMSIAYSPFIIVSSVYICFVCQSLYVSIVVHENEHLFLLTNLQVRTPQNTRPCMHLDTCIRQLHTFKICLSLLTIACIYTSQIPKQCVIQHGNFLSHNSYQQQRNYKVVHDKCENIRDFRVCLCINNRTMQTLECEFNISTVTYRVMAFGLIFSTMTRVFYNNRKKHLGICCDSYHF